MTLEKKTRPLALTPKEAPRGPAEPNGTATRLEQQLRRAEVEIEALKAARDTALRLAVWGRPACLRTDAG